MQICLYNKMCLLHTFSNNNSPVITPPFMFVLIFLAVARTSAGIQRLALSDRAFILTMPQILLLLTVCAAHVHVRVQLLLHEADILQNYTVQYTHIRVQYRTTI